MAKSNTEKKVLPLLEPIVAERGLELVDLEFVKEGANWYLRVYIDKEGGVSMRWKQSWMKKTQSNRLMCWK